MTNSGIEWIGKIPEHWEISKLKYHVLKIGSGITPSGGSETYVDDGIPLIRSQNVHFDGLHLDDVVYITPEIHKEMKRTKLQINDVLLNITGASIGRCTYIPKNFGEGNVNQHVCIIRPSGKLNHIYLSFYLSSSYLQTLINSLQVGASRQGLTIEDIGSFTVLLSSIDEQKQISEFLVEKTKEIDSLITKRNHLIEILQEKRQVVINEATTKGFDPKTPAKNIANKWIEKISENWELMPLKHMLETPVTDGPHETPEFIDEGIPFLSVDSIKDKKLDFTNTRYISEQDHIRYSLKCKPRKYDLLLGKAASVGKIAMVDVDFEFNIWSPLALIRFKKENFPKFFYYFMQNTFFQDQIFLNVNFNTQGNIGMKDIQNLLILSPLSIEEQKSISGYLDDFTRRIDKIIKTIEIQSKSLQEFRQAIISETVTGKIDVRKEAIMQ